MDSMQILQLVLRWAHVLSAIALMGGAVFARFALVPTLAELSAEGRRDMHEKLRGQWAKVVHTCVGLLLVTGLTNLVLASQYEFSGLFNNKSYNITAGVKFLLALPVIAIASMFVGRSALGQKMRENAKFWLSLNLALAVIVVMVGGALKFANRVPKERGSNVAAVALDFAMPLAKD
jgi:hypothetical protein